METPDLLPKRLEGARGPYPKMAKGENAKIIIEASSADQLREIARVTRLSLTQVTNSIIVEALKRIELVPTTIYDFRIK